MPKRDLKYFLLSFRERMKGFRFLFDAFDNWNDFAMLWFGMKNEVTLTCRDKKINLKTVHINREKGRISLVYKKKRLLFGFKSDRQLANTMRNIYQNFIQEQYESMDVRKREVVDIGANNGDSAMYFVVNGASKVYAYEPYPSSFDEAEKNIQMNGMQKRINLINEAVDKRRGTITLDTDYTSVSNSMLEKSNRGRRIRVTTLERIVKENGLKNAVLKIDCEGSEYGIFDGTSDDTFAAFDQVAMEYHFGHESLVERLKGAGFKVKYTEPKVSMNAETNGLRMVYGMIYARR